ncbi:Alkaline phosphatase synthesis sensor protein PhoR [compost metagenome]
MIEAESGRLSKLSDSLLKLTMLEARRGIAKAELTEYALDLQLKRTVLAVEPLWLAKQLELDIEVAPVTISGDEDALRQVWTNLLHNAIKFTPERGRSLRTASREKARYSPYGFRSSRKRSYPQPSKSRSRRGLCRIYTINIRNRCVSAARRTAGATAGSDDLLHSRCAIAHQKVSLTQASG